MRKFAWNPLIIMNKQVNIPINYKLHDIMSLNFTPPHFGNCRLKRIDTTQFLDKDTVFPNISANKTKQQYASYIDALF